MNGVTSFDTYENTLLTIQIADENLAQYKIVEKGQTEKAAWMMPAVSNYSEWVFPDAVWLSNTSIVLPATEKGGQLDQLQESYKLVRVTDGEQEVLIEDGVTMGRLFCSPNGQMCLTGYATENLINLKTKKETVWLEFPE